MKLEIGNLKKALLGLACLLLAGNSFAADVRMSVTPEIISLLDRAVLKIEFTDANGEAAEIPSVDGLEINYRGPQTQYSFINGKSTSSVTHTYLITPSKVGDYTIGPVTIKLKGKEKTLTAKLRVIKPQDDPAAQQLSQMLYSRISTDRTAPYVHEPFDLDLKVYIRDGIQIDGNFGIQGGLPESGMDGELTWKISGQHREEINGSIFSVYDLHATAKTLTAGTFSFRPEVQLNIVVPRQQRRSWGFEDPFFGDLFGRQETRPIVLDCNKLDIEVKTIPMAGRPASFTGGVGIMDFDVDVAPAQVKAGEPVTVKMRITGAGNLEKITPPVMADHPGIKRYDANPVPSDHPNEIRFEQVLIPTSDDVSEIPAITFSYFNTQTSDFRTIKKGPFAITVEPVPQQTAQVVTGLAGAAPQETKVLGLDIAYLKPRPAKWTTSPGTGFRQTPAFRVLLALPALMVLLTGVAVRRRNHLANNVAKARRQKAPKAARRNVQLAEQAMRRKDAAAFHEALWNALAEYFGHRLNLAPGQVSLHTVLSRMSGETDALEQLFNTIEQRRYGSRPGETGAEAEMKTLLKQLVSTLKKCERMKL